MRVHNTLFLLLSQTRLFWKFRATFTRAGFLGHREFFGVRHRIQEHGIRARSFFSLARLTLGQLGLAILVAVALQVSDPYLTHVYTAYGLDITDDSEYGTLLATVTGIGGLFIGLYYTAISAIGGAIYSRVPNNIRDLLAQERIGNVYMRFLALVTYLGVILLAFRTAGFPPIVLAVPVFILASGISIIAFVRLGARVFDLFDPTSLSHHLFHQLRRNYRQVMAGQYRWSDPAFQSYAHRSARSAVDTLSTLADITAREPHLNGQPLATLCKHLLFFLRIYEPAKRRIPTESLWYAKRYIYPDWYKTSDSTTSLVHQTGTSLPPDNVSDPRWLEGEILPIVYNCIRLNLERGRYEIVTDLLSNVDAYLQQLCKEHQVQTALQTIKDLVSQCADLVFASVPDDLEREPLEQLGMADTLGAMPISVLLAYMRSIEESDLDSDLARLKQIDWRSVDDIYAVNLPLYALPQLEWLRPRLEFEFSSEGRQISPHWYICELVVQTVSENAKATITGLVGDAQAIYGAWSKTATEKKLPWVIACVLSREAEYWNKLDVNLTKLRERWAGLNSSRRIEGLPWPTLDLNELDRIRNERRNDVLRLMSVESTILSLTPRPESYPDFAGQFLHTVGEALVSAMYENDGRSVEALFKTFFHGTLLQYERLRPKGDVADWPAQIELKVAVAPLLDLMDLSGYAFLYSEYHDNPALSEPVISSWNEYLDENKKTPPQATILFLADVSLSETMFELPHRGLLRTRWSQIAFRRLRDLERKRVSGRGEFFDADTIVVHESPLVRIFSREPYGSFHDGIDIFLAKYIRRRDDGKDADFGARRRELQEQLEREEKRYAEALADE